MSDIQIYTPIEAEAQARMFGVLKKYERSLKEVLPKHLSGNRIAWLAVNSIRQNPALAGTSPVSFLNSVMLASNMGLEIRRNSAYLVPFGKECQLIVDYRGKLDLARRAGVRSITVELVREYDEFDFERTSAGTKFRHRPNVLARESGRLVPVEESGEVVLGYAMADLGAGEPQIEVMTLAQIEAIRRRAKSGCAVDFQHYGKTVKGLTLSDIRKIDGAALPFRDPYRVPWVTDWDQMARKTLAHRICNYIQQSPALLVSQEVDESVHSGTAMPVSSDLMSLMAEIDPADNQPMVVIPEGAEAQREEQKKVAERKLAQKPPTYIEPTDPLPDPNASDCPLWARKTADGPLYQRVDDGSGPAWRLLK